VAALEGHIATLKGDIERLEAQLISAATDLTAERAKAEKASRGQRRRRSKQS
jgi:uncharacterized small protein (DUF1192 family)